MSSSLTNPSAEFQPAGSRLSPLMLGFERWTVLYFGLSCLFHLFNYFVLHRHGHLVNPVNLDPNETFYDFTIFIDKFKLFGTADFFAVGFPINYPAPVCLCFEAFFKYGGQHPTRLFVPFSVLAFLVPAWLFARALIHRGISSGRAVIFAAALFLLSWPVLLILDVGNAEVFVWLALLVAMWAYATGRLWLAAAFFGVAASMKLFPFVFLALFLSRRHFTKLLFGTATFLVVSVVSLKVLGPTVAVAYRGIVFGLAAFKANYMQQWHTNENGVEHSIFCLVKLVLVGVFHHGITGFPHWLSVYLALTAIAGTLLYFLRIRYMPLLNQVLALSIASIYFTAFSGDGTLIHLYYPLAMLFLLSLQAWRQGVTVPGLSTLIYSMAFCVSLESFLTLPSKGGGLRMMGPAHAIALGIMLYVTLRYPMGPPLAEDLGETVLSQPVLDWAVQPQPARA